MRILSSGRYAAVASTLALAVSLGGVSYAAVVVTGAQIENNTVTTKDIKDKTLKVKDFAASTATHLRGAPGPAGPAGPAGGTGPAGQTGPVGPSNVYATYNDGATVLIPSSYKALLEIKVQPGSYWAHSTVGLQRTSAGGAQHAACSLVAAGIAVDSASESLADFAGANGSMSNQVVFTVSAPTAVTLSCYGDSTNAVWKKLTVLRVGDVANSFGPNVP